MHFKIVRLALFSFSLSFSLSFFFKILFSFCLIRLSLFWTVGSGMIFFKLDFFLLNKQPEAALLEGEAASQFSLLLYQPPPHPIVPYTRSSDNWMMQL